MATDNASIMTTVGVGAISVVAAATKTSQWYDVKTGRISLPLLIGGVATCLIMAACVRAGGVHYGLEPWVQVMLSGVLCYVGPDPILRGIAGVALKRFGVEENDNANSGKRP